ncbi:MAG: putative DNA binding domain-containing protein, partial [Bacteroidales bacterium]|nr:putative DNA binding domain-containing protein [Bacteroidales bacterium]
MEEDIYKLLEEGEHSTLECKRALSNIPNSVWETYSAFANTNGGIILLGIYENLKEQNRKLRFQVTGVEDADKLQHDFWNMLNNPQKVSANILLDENITSIPIEDKTILKIEVPRADSAFRPVFINGNPLTGAYMRNHEGDYHMSRPILEMMMRDAHHENIDGEILPYYNMEDIDGETLKKYRNHFSSKNPDHVWSTLDDKDFLIQLGAYGFNRKDKSEGLTIGGLLLFGKGLPIRTKFPNLIMDYLDLTGIIGNQRWSDRITYDGTWENNIYNFLMIVLPRLTREFPRAFAMEGMERVDDTPLHKAVREALANAIIHCDVKLDGTIKAVKYPDRIEITNPGLLSLPLSQIYHGGKSKARNKVIRNALRMIGLGENIGSGFPLILHAWKNKNWEEPIIKDFPELEETKLILKINFSSLTLEETNRPENGTKDGTKDGQDGTKDGQD